MELYDSFIMLEETISILRNANKSTLLLVFGEKYFGKTEFVKTLHEQINSDRDSISININSELNFYSDGLKRSPLALCYISSILYTLKDFYYTNSYVFPIFCDYLCKDYMPFDKLMLKMQIKNLRKLIKKNKINESYKVLMELLKDFHIHKLRQLLAEINLENIKYNFIINLYKFSEFDIEELCNIDDKLITNFVFTMRPKKSNMCYINNLKNESKCDVYIRYLVPDLSENLPQDYFTIYTPRLTKLFIMKNIDIQKLSDDEIFNITIKDTYYANIEIGHLNTKEELLLFSIILSNGVLTKYQIRIMDEFIGKSSYNQLSYEMLDNNEIIWNVDGSYRVIDGWREYLLLKYYVKDIVREMERFFCMIYGRLYTGTYTNDRLVELKNDNYSFWLNARLSRHYHELVTYGIKLSKEKKKHNNMSSLERDVEIADFIINSDFAFSEELCEVSILLFESTHKFNLLLYNLERIEDNFKNVNDVTLKDFKYIKEFLGVVVHYSDKWHDITLIEKVLKICSYFYLNFNSEKSIILGEIEKVFTCQKYRDFQKNFSLDFLEELLQKNRCYDFINDIVQKGGVSMKIDVLIMVATIEEENAIVNNDMWLEQISRKGYTYYIKNEKNVAFALARGINKGESDASIMGQALLDELKPKAIAMAGFCAGKKEDVNLGDIVVPYKIYNYDYLGKQIGSDDILPEISSFFLNDKWKQNAERFGDKWRKSLNMKSPKDFDYQCINLLTTLNSNEHLVKVVDIYDEKKYPDWKEILSELKNKEYINFCDNEKIEISILGKTYINEWRIIHPKGFEIGSPKTVVGVLATGTKVQQWDGIFKILNKKHDRKTNVLDMEGHAIGKLASFNDIPFIIAKGVGDFAQGNKAFANRFINYTSYASCRFLIEFFTSEKISEMFNEK